MPNSATSQFFINVADNTMLDQPNARDGEGYAKAVRECEVLARGIASEANRVVGVGWDRWPRYHGAVQQLRELPAVVVVATRARGHRASPVEVPWRHLADARPVARSDRDVYFGAAIGYVRTPVIGRAHLAGEPQAGPLVIEEYDSTVVVPPGWSAQRNAIGFIILELEQ